MPLAADALYFADQGIGVQVGQVEKLVVGLFDAVFHSQPVEHFVHRFVGASCAEPLF